MTLKAPEIKEKVASQLVEKLQTDGYTYKKTNNEFIHQKGDYSFIFNIEQVAWSSSFSIDVHLYISQKKIEAILEKIIGKLHHKITMGDEIGRIFKSPDGRKRVQGSMPIWIRQDEDVEAAIESLGYFYNDIAKPYFARFHCLEAIDDIMNNPPFDHSPAYVGGMFGDRCMKGLIVAKLVDNPNYEKLVTIYDEEIKATWSDTLGDFYIGNYHKVREYLMYNRIK